MLKIIDLLQDNKDGIEQAAQVLVDGFAGDWELAWPDMETLTFILM